MTDTDTKSTGLAVLGSGVDGLEDVDSTDILTPILRMDHEKMKFVLSLTNEEMTSLTCIALGLVKQRILWPADPGPAGEQPLCRSYDHNFGIPNQERFHSFTKGASGFDLARVQQAETDPLPCANCALKEWDTHPRSAGSWCNEQYTLPILIVQSADVLMPALVSFQRSAIKPTKAYISGFVGKKRPLFTSFTRLSIQAMTKGTAAYAVPRFEVLEDTDPAQWPEYSKHFHAIKGMITTPRTRDDDESTTATPVDVQRNTATATTSEVAEEVGGGNVTKRSTPEAAAAPAARPTDPIYGDEEPF